MRPPSLLISAAKPPDDFLGRVMTMVRPVSAFFNGLVYNNWYRTRPSRTSRGRARRLSMPDIMFSVRAS